VPVAREEAAAEVSLALGPLPSPADAKALKHFAVTNMLHLAATDPLGLVRFRATEWIALQAEKMEEQQRAEVDPVRAKALDTIERIFAGHGIFFNQSPMIELETERQSSFSNDEDERRDNEAEGADQ
jgi:hypothetical protein